VNKTVKVTEFEVATLLDSSEARSFFMADAFESGDAAFIAHALGICARAAGITALARETGLSRAQLYSSLSKDGNPTLQTLLAVTKHLGITLSTREPNSDADGHIPTSEDSDQAVKA
jgi:probable addiction module antidote protein